jgi:thiosulfate/3-mercaptopyruvate sulfurtransferase
MKTFLATTASLAILSGAAFAAEPLISVDDLAGMMGDANLVILDVRSNMEMEADNPYAEGHIPGAVAANYRATPWRGSNNGVNYVLPPTEAIQATIQGLGIDNDDHVVIYANRVSPKALDLGAATRVYWTLQALGHDNVSILDGGYLAWVGAGNAVSTEAVTPEAGNFTAALQPGFQVQGYDVEAAMANAVELLDSRPAAQFMADAQLSYARWPGTIPTAVNIPAPSLASAEAGASFGDLSNMAERLAAVGIEPGETVYTFCNSGHHATVTWFVLSELMGYDAQLYDGSIYDWTQVRRMPTVIGATPEVSSNASQ